MRKFQKPTAEQLQNVPAEFPETAKVSGLTDTMVGVDERWDHLKAVRAAGYQTPKDNADIEPAIDAADEASAAEPADIEAEDEKDLARLDGDHPDETAGEETVRSSPSGSLLDLADRDDEPIYVADNSDDAPVSAEATEGPAKAEAGDAEAQPATGGTSQVNDPAADDDSMTSADFRDAEDNEDWAQPDEDAAAPDKQAVASAEVVPAAVIVFELRRMACACGQEKPRPIRSADLVIAFS